MSGQSIKWKQFLLLLFFISSTSSAFINTSDSLAETLSSTLQDIESKYPHRYEFPNASTPELGALLEDALRFISESKAYKARSKNDLAFRALWTQTINQLTHSSFDFEKEATDYPHKDLFPGKYPQLPVLKGLEKALDFINFVEKKPETRLIEKIVDLDLEKKLLIIQQKVAKTIVQNPLETYEKYNQLLTHEGLNASFTDFESTVNLLILRLSTEPDLIAFSLKSDLVRNFRAKAIDELEKVRVAGLPYMKTIEAIERAMECYDVYHRSIDPARSPVLYHSGRYEYYLHYLKAEAPRHILFPTTAFLGATDLLKTRGVPIGFAGINTEIAYVDGYYQTPFEFYIHDINHSRRMFLFFEKAAKKHGFSIGEMAKHSDQFVKDVIIPLTSINPNDDRETKNQKRLIKILFFEVLHEDALAALPELIQEAILRKAGVRTPFERIDKGRKVVYLMESGATTLAYVYRKLAHDFYDMPADRFSNIVEPEFRTYEYIANAAKVLFEKLGIKIDKTEIDRLLKDDTGLPADFNSTLQKDRLLRPGDSVPLINSERAFALAFDLFKKYHIDSTNIDPSRQPNIINFTRDERKINVLLNIPVKDERGHIEVMVPVTQEFFGISKIGGSATQIRGQRRIIEIESGNYLNLNTLHSEFLIHLNSKDYLIALKAEDPKANDLIKVIRKAGLESVLLIDVNKARQTPEVSPTFFATLNSSRSVNSFWNQLLNDGKKETLPNGDLRLTFDRPQAHGFRDIIMDLEKKRLSTSRNIEDNLISNGSSLINISDYSTKFGAEKTPIIFYISESIKWESLSDAEKNRIKSMIERAFDGLNPDKISIVHGGTNTGLDAIIQSASELRGFSTLALLSEERAQSLIGTFKLGAVIARSDNGKLNPTLEFANKSKAHFFLFSSAQSAKAELDLAVSHSIKPILIPVSSSSKKITQQFDFLHNRPLSWNGDDFLGRLYEKQPIAIAPNYQTSTRDYLFQEYSKTVTQKGTEILSFQQLVNKSKGMKTFLLNGYVGLSYKYPEKVREALVQIMKENGDNVVYVGAGTHDGIGLVSDWIPDIAKDLGFKNVKTASIVSRNASVSRNLAPSDWVHFVSTDPKDWRPLSSNGDDIQLQYLQDTGGKLIVFEGGEITGKVVEAALQNHIPVNLYVGEYYQPDPRRVEVALSQRLNTVINFSNVLVSNRKKYPTLKIIPSKPPKKPICKKFYE